MLINWTGLQPYKTTKSKSFEQLCYQLASRKYNGEGIFTPIDDSGGGDGVEFYLTLPDGSELGWQAKYYEGSARLNVSNRKAQITKSLKQAINKHPNLKTWFFCLPMDLTKEEKLWLDNEFVQYIPLGRTIGIEFWGETFMHEKINHPDYNGIKQSFFNELELSQDWFQSSFEKSFSLVKNKFDDLLYTHNQEFEYYYVNPVLCNQDFVKQRIEYYPRKLKELFNDAKKKLNDLNYTNDLWRPFFKEYLKRYSEFNRLIEELLPAFDQRIAAITPNTVFDIDGENFDRELAIFRGIQGDLDVFRGEWTKQNRIDLSSDPDKRNFDQLKKLSPVESVYKEFIEELNYYVSHTRIPIESRISHYLGNGGDGKTNFCIGLAKRFLAENLPVIYIPAILFTSAAPIAEQILVNLDIRGGYSFIDFLDCVNELGKICNKRIPIILDGLNEAVNAEGHLNPRLELDIPKLECDFLKFTNLVLITTCRTSYQSAIWPSHKFDGNKFHNLYGFTSQNDKKKLIRKYFDHYKIQSDLTFLSLERFTKPLYLKIFCESVNPERRKIREISLGFDSIYSIFDDFVDLCNANIFKRIKKSGKLMPSVGNRTLASKVLGTLAEKLWKNHHRAFLLTDLQKIADHENSLDYKDSITKALLDEELLFVRNWHNGEENVYLTYDLLAGYFIAKFLVETIDDFLVFLNGEEAKILIGGDYDTLHPNHEDIVDGLCSLLPIKKGIFIHSLLGLPAKSSTDSHKKLFDKSVAATLLLSPEFITAEQILFISDLSGDNHNLNYLLDLSKDIFFITNHPFNFSFWASRISKLQMGERDFTWSEFIRGLDNEFLEDVIFEFENIQEFPNLSPEQLEKTKLVSCFLMWTFTSTNKKQKGKSARALYKFGIKFPGEFLELFYLSAQVNDPSLFEWMSMVLYNVLISVTKNSIDKYYNDLEGLSQYLNEQVFSPDSESSTNNLITRNYLFNIYKLLSRKFIGSAHVFDIHKLRDRFKKMGITNWKEADDLQKGMYRDGNSLIDYHFNKHKMPYVVVGKGSEYNRTPEFLSVQAKLRWRAYDLGYEFEKFGEIDIEIARYKHWGEDFAAVERYADKYIEIAFLEYCGFLEGNGELKSSEDFGYLRAFEVIDDPSDLLENNKESATGKRFVDKSFIDTEVSLKVWGNNHSVPNILGYLNITDFLGKKGDWVLLHSLVQQKKQEAERQIFFRTDAILVNSKDIHAARNAFSDSVQLGWGNDSIPNTFHIHDSEIPDADSIPYNDFTKWRYSTRSRTIEREYTEIVLQQNGKALSTKEADKVWNSVLKDLHYMAHARIDLSDFKVPLIRFRSPNSEDDTIEAAFERLNIKLVDKTFWKKEEQEIDQYLKVNFPVRYFKNAAHLSKNLIDDLDLSSRNNDADLFDQQGDLASFNHTIKFDHEDEEAFTYLRQDLLDDYLLENNLKLFHVVWGERDYYPKDGDWDSAHSMGQRKWAKFYGAYEYKIN